MAADATGPRDQHERQRVLMTADTLGGVWQYALELARGLLAAGDEVVLATMGRLPDAAQRAEAAAVPGLVLHARDYRLLWMGAPWKDLARARDWLLSLARRHAPTVVHLNDFGHAALPWPAPTVLVAHSDVVSWWHAVHGTAPPPGWNRYARLVQRALRGADAVVAPTAHVLAGIRHHYGEPRGGHVIHNGRSRPDDDAGRGQAGREPVVLAAGRLWDPAKNLAALADVAPALDWPVEIAGEARAPDGTEVAFDGVRLRGALPTAAMRERYARATIYALPARYEPFGLSALEAAQGGCALVLGDIGSLREVWGESALYVGPDDREALRATLQRLIAEPDLRRRYAERARIRAARYDAGRMRAQYQSLYRAVRANWRLPRGVVAHERQGAPGDTVQVSP